MTNDMHINIEISVKNKREKNNTVCDDALILFHKLQAEFLPLQYISFV